MMHNLLSTWWKAETKSFLGKGLQAEFSGRKEMESNYIYIYMCVCVYVCVATIKCQKDNVIMGYSHSNPNLGIIWWQMFNTKTQR